MRRTTPLHLPGRTLGRAPSRRDFLGMAAAAGISVPLIGSCASGTSSDDSSDGSMDQVDFNPPSEYSGREHNVVIWSAFGGTNGEAMDALIKRFNDSQEDIYAEVQFQGAYAESAPKLTSAIQAGQAPDLVVLSDAYWGTFFLSDMLMPFDDIFDEQFNKDIYIENLINEGVAADQQLYWLSFARSTPLFYYNRDRFAEAGLPDRGPESWSELREWGPKLAELQVEGQPLKALLINANPGWHFLAISWSFGGRFSEGLDITIDSDEVLEAGTWLQSFFFDDDMGYMASEPYNDFANGLSATALLSTGVLGTVSADAQFEVGASPLPVENVQRVPTGGAGIVMIKGISQERRDASAEVLKFLATPESSAEWTLATGYLPVVEAAIDQPELAAKIDEDPKYRVALDQLPFAEPLDDVIRFVPGAFEGSINSDLQRLFSDGSADPEQVLSGLAEDLQSAADDVRDKYESKV